MRTWLCRGVGTLQPLTPPYALHPILADPPAGTLEQRRDPPVAIAPIVACQRDDRPSQGILIGPVDRPVGLAAPPLPPQPARVPCPPHALPPRGRHPAP